jgi:hypothetical protein
MRRYLAQARDSARTTALVEGGKEFWDHVEFVAKNCQPGAAPSSVEDATPPHTAEEAREWLLKLGTTALREAGGFNQMQINLMAGFAEAYAAPIRAELERAKAALRTMCITELAVENQSVRDYVQHWEGRTLKAEAALERFTKHMPDGYDIGDDMTAVLAVKLIETEEKLREAERLLSEARKEPQK